MLHPPTNSDTPITRMVLTTAMTCSMRVSRSRSAWTCWRTSVPQCGQRPPGLRTSGAWQLGQLMVVVTGMRGDPVGLEESEMPGENRPDAPLPEEPEPGERCPHLAARWNEPQRNLPAAL